MDVVSPRPGIPFAALKFSIPEGAQTTLELFYDGRPFASVTLDLPLVVGSLDRVGAGRAIGWYAKIGGDPGPVMLQVDGRDAVAVTCREFRGDLIEVSHRGGRDGFSELLPPEALDGRPHRFTLSCGGTTFGGSRTWRADYRMRVEQFDGRTVSGWAYDPSAPDLPVELAVAVPGGETVRTRTGVRDDVRRELGAAMAGFTARIDAKAEAVRVVPWGADPETGATLARSSLAREVARLQRAMVSLRTNALAASSMPADALASSLSRVRGLTDVSAPQAVSRPLRNNPAPRSSRPLVIVPVYSGYDEVVACLESVGANTSDADVLVVNDASPQPEITAYLKSWAERASATLIENEENLGFPKSVNTGLAEAKGRDVVLLNADTVVPKGWIARLRDAAYSRPNVGSVTPLTNNGTILGYPRTNFENGRYAPDVQAADDDVRSACADLPFVELPTAVGFCMYITHHALDDVGFFGEEWGRGYGEEVDWCIRALDRGFVHLATPCLFVEHEGSVSFGVETREELQRVSGAKILEKYPEYLESVQLFLQRDPLGDARRAVDRHRLLADRRPLVIALTNGLGGGTGRYIGDLEDELGALGRPALRLEPRRIDGPFDPATDQPYLLHDPDNGFHNFWTAEGVGALLSELAGVRSVTLHVHSTVGWKLSEMTAIVERAAQAGARIVATVHDHAWFCPRVTMLYPNGLHCGGPAIETCEQCVRDGRFEHGVDQGLLEQGGVAAYRDAHRQLVEIAHRLIAPSESAAAFIASRLDGPEPEVLPHPEPVQEVALRGVDPRAERFTIGFLGAIGPQKGYFALKALVAEVERDELPLDIVVIGYTADDAALVAESPSVVIHGPYPRDEIPTLVKGYRVDLVCMPSPWPETYSYTLSEAWQAGVPVAGAALGALGERIGRVTPRLVMPTGVLAGGLGAWLLDTLRSGACSEKRFDMRAERGRASVVF